MSESLDQEPNKIIVTISHIQGSTAQPWVRKFTVSIQNSIDDTKTYPNNNSEDTPNYLETEDLEKKLVLARRYLHDIFCSTLKHIELRMEENKEESDDV